MLVRLVKQTSGDAAGISEFTRICIFLYIFKKYFIKIKFSKNDIAMGSLASRDGLQTLATSSEPIWRRERRLTRRQNP